MWLVLLWAVTMLVALFTTFSFSGKSMHEIMWLLFAVSCLLSYRSKRRIASVWFSLITAFCVMYDSIRSLIG